MEPFHPITGATASLAATTSSASVPLAGLPRAGKFQLRIYNAGPATAFINRGDSTVTAAVAGGYPLPPGAIEVITVNNAEAAPVTTAAAITASGSATVYFTTGWGA